MQQRIGHSGNRVADPASRASCKYRPLRMTDGPHSAAKSGGLVIGALGVVYGDIGTSPLYAFEEAFTEEAHTLTVDRINVFGICSLAFWSLVIIISIKYLMFVMRADNNGEGGILALTSLVMKKREPGQVAKAGVLVGLGHLRHGAALRRRHHHARPSRCCRRSAGSRRSSPGLGDWVVPIAVVILVALFVGAEPRHRRRRQGVRADHDRLVLGARRARRQPGRTPARDPAVGEPDLDGALLRPRDRTTRSSRSARSSWWSPAARRCTPTWATSAVDPIVRGWYMVVFPALVLNYWGQGALLLRDPEAIDGMFFNLAPEGAAAAAGASWRRWPPSSRRRRSSAVCSRSPPRPCSSTICRASASTTPRTSTHGPDLRPAGELVAGRRVRRDW